MKILGRLFLFLLLFSVAAYFTRPSDRRCFDAALKAYEASMGQTEKDLPRMLPRPLFRKLRLNRFQKELQVKDGIFYKEIFRRKGGKRTNIGWGAFGFVHITLN